MTIPKPEYHLHNHFYDGSETPCEIVEVADLLNSAEMPRRNVLGAGVALATVLTAFGIRTSQAAENTRRTPVHAHMDQISGLLVPSGSDTLISSSLDNQIKVWKLPSGELNRVISQHNDAILTLSQSSDGKLMATGDRSGSTLLWNLPSAGFNSRVSMPGEPIMVALFTPQGDELAIVTSTGDVIVRSTEDLRDEKKTRRLKSPAQINHMLNETWNLDAALLETLSDKKTELSAFWLSADATLLTYADRKKRVHVLRLPGKQSVAELTRTQLVEVLVMDRAGRYLASAQKNRRIVVTDLESGENFPEITGYDATLTCMVFSSDGKQLASGHSDGSIALWSVATGQRFGFCFDPESSSDRGTSFTINGVALTYTQPCGSPIPPNATCTCNCVPGRAVRVTRSKTVKIPVQPAKNQPAIPYFPTPFFFPSNGGSTCSCVPVCTCIPVFR